MYLMLSAGVFLWLVYGIRLYSLPFILANSVTLALTLAILGLKIRHKQVVQGFLAQSLWIQMYFGIYIWCFDQ